MARWSGEIVDLGVGQPDFPTPGHIKEAGRRAIDENYTRYTPQPGFQDLREVLARKFRSENRLDVSPDQVVVSCGAKHSTFQIIHCLVRPGDEVIILSPYWYAYLVQVKYAGGNPVLVPTRQEDRFHPDVGAVRAAVTGATKALVINSPCNPTGAVYGRQLLAELAELAVERDLFVISDEVYEKILFDGAEHVSIGSLGADIAERTVTVNSVSKTHSMTGWRIGYAAMPIALAEQVTELQGDSTSGPCAIAQRAALCAVTERSDHTEAMAAEYAIRREYLLDRTTRLEELSCRPPEGAFYLFADVAALYGRKIAGHRINGSVELAEVLLDEAGVRIVPGAEFGSDRHVRLSFATSMEALEEGMDRIERLLR